MWWAPEEGASSVDRDRLGALRIDGARLWDSLMQMAEIGATPRGGNDRQALTDEDKRGRDLFVRWCSAAGLSVEVDRIGNEADISPVLPVRNGGSVKRHCRSGHHHARRIE